MNVFVQGRWLEVSRSPGWGEIWLQGPRVARQVRGTKGLTPTPETLNKAGQEGCLTKGFKKTTTTRGRWYPRGRRRSDHGQDTLKSFPKPTEILHPAGRRAVRAATRSRLGNLLGTPGSPLQETKVRGFQCLHGPSGFTPVATRSDPLSFTLERPKPGRPVYPSMHRNCFRVCKKLRKRKCSLKGGVRAAAVGGWGGQCRGGVTQGQGLRSSQTQAQGVCIFRILKSIVLRSCPIEQRAFLPILSLCVKQLKVHAQRCVCHICQKQRCLRFNS